MRAAKAQYSADELEVASAQVVEVLLADPCLRAAQTVLLYHPLPDEVDVRPLLERLRREGKTVLLPRVTDMEGGMELRRYTSASDLEKGAFGIMEPCGEVFTDYMQIDYAVVPGMAFDRQGSRLGRGRGYYDRLLPRLTRARKVGVGFSYQLVDQVPTEAHDVQMDAVVTPTCQACPTLCD